VRLGLRITIATITLTGSITVATSAQLVTVVIAPPIKFIVMSVVTCLFVMVAGPYIVSEQTQRGKLISYAIGASCVKNAARTL
jgi:hypothetical protein